MSDKPKDARVRYEVCRTGAGWGVRKDGLLILIGLRNRERARIALRGLKSR